MGNGLLEGITFAPPTARRFDPETSHIAAASMVSVAKTRRVKILRLLAQSQHALNGGDIDVCYGWPSNAAGRRLVELRRAGLVARTGATRQTPEGKRHAHVYAITPVGRAWLRQYDGD